jgi:hypothetical protein
MYRTYCRVAAVVFAVFTAYPVVTKALDHRLAEDWAHSALHLVSALVAAYAGWFGPPLVARLFVTAIAIGYTALGVFGWFTDGLFLGTAVAIPLGPVDNVFHLALGLPALAILILAGARSRRSPDPVPIADKR